MPINGPGSIDTLSFEEYNGNLKLLLQQKMSKFRSTGVIQGVSGRGAQILEQMGKAVTQEIAGRHGDTPIGALDYDRRWVNPTELETGHLFDKVDDLKNISDPRGMAVMTQAAALGRDLDDIILAGLGGNNQTGQNGTTATPFAAGNIIPAGGTKFTIDKLREVQELMLDKDIDMDGMDPVVALISPQMRRHLLETTEVTSSDYNTVKALSNGDVDTFMGFKFISSNRIPGAAQYNTGAVDVDKDIQIAANTQRAFFYPQSGLALGTWQDVETRVDERADKRYATQIYSWMVCGATRTEENKVYAVDVDTTA